ncbi:MAG: hypothetical protein ACTSU5_10940 [Promethearchaeota archaeon]
MSKLDETWGLHVTSEMFMTTRNNYPRVNEYSLTKPYMAPGTSEVGIRTNSSFNVKNKRIVVIGQPYAPNASLGFYNGAAPLGSVQGFNFVGVELTEDTNERRAADSNQGMVSDLFLYNGSSGRQRWVNPYVTPMDCDVLKTDCKKMDFDLKYVFDVDASGNLTLSIYEDGLSMGLIAEHELGKIPWDTAYFQISGQGFEFKSFVVSELEPESTTRAGGVEIFLSVERSLIMYNTLTTEIAWTFVLGLISLVVVGIYFLRRRGFGGVVATNYASVMVVVSVILCIKYYPIWDVVGLNRGYYWVADSYLGEYAYQKVQLFNPAIYYLLLFAPIFLLLTWIFSKPDPNKFFSVPKKYRKFVLTIPSVWALLVLMAITISTQLMVSMTFFYLLLLIPYIYIDQFKDGQVAGGKPAGTSGKNAKLKKLMSYGMFFYFVLKVVLESYKVFTTTNPFEDKGGFSKEVSLGSVLPLLQGYGVPPGAISVIAVVFSDYLTFVMLGLSIVRGAMSERKSALSLLGAALLAMWMFFIPPSIEMPFFSMLLSLLYICGWIMGNYNLKGKLEPLLKAAKDEMGISDAGDQSEGWREDPSGDLDEEPSDDATGDD